MYYKGCQLSLTNEREIIIRVKLCCITLHKISMLVFLFSLNMSFQFNGTLITEIE